MSRTDNTAPIRIQIEDGKTCMVDTGGINRGSHELIRRQNRRQRHRVRAELRKGEEPASEQHRHGIKWELW